MPQTQPSSSSSQTPPDSPQDPSPESPSAPPEEPKVFDEAYVTKLRDEAAKHRRDRKALAERLLDTTVKGTAIDLADASDLLVYVDRAELLDDDGLPDPEKILAAQEDLLSRKPHLRSREPRGDIDQGGRGQKVETFSFNDWLRSAAH